ncbi:MAG: hypothetical protein MHPSP_000694 [Paramarteilia canceri]
MENTGFYRSADGLSIAYINLYDMDFFENENKLSEICSEFILKCQTKTISNLNYGGIDILITNQPPCLDQSAQSDINLLNVQKVIAYSTKLLKPRYHICLSNRFLEHIPYINHESLMEKAKLPTRLIEIQKYGQESSKKSQYAFKIDPIAKFS